MMTHDPHAHVGKWTEYMHSRRGDFDFRSRTRYGAVAAALIDMGLKDGDLIVDVGAGTCQFDHHMRTVEGWSGRYLGIDAVLDGTDLNEWNPKWFADFFVCIEVVEHLLPYASERLIRTLPYWAQKGVVMTTPNAAAVDVLACDPTHISVAPASLFEQHDYATWAREFFGTPADTLIATSRGRHVMAAKAGSQG